MSGDEESQRSLSLDYLNLLINGQAFTDVTFSVEGHLVHAHRCILAARSQFFRKYFQEPEGPGLQGAAIHVNSVGYEVFLLVLQFLYSGQVSIVPDKHHPDTHCSHRHCSPTVDLALRTLAAARSFGVEQLALLVQMQLENMVEKARIEDVMKVLVASSKQHMDKLWTTCSHLVANSGLPLQILAKHLPIDVVTKIEDLRLNSSSHHHLQDQNIRRMRRALLSADVELVKLMVMTEGLNLDESLALHFAVENCTRDVVKALLELGVLDVNRPMWPGAKTPLHIAAAMVSPEMVSVLLDHQADPNTRTIDGTTPLDLLRTLTSEFLFKGAIPGLAHIEPNKLRLCLELVQSAVTVMSREAEGLPQPCDVSPVSDDQLCGGEINLDSAGIYVNRFEEDVGRTKRRRDVVNWPSPLDRRDYNYHYCEYE